MSHPGATMTSSPIEGSGGATPLRRVELGLIFAFWTFMALLSAANGVLDPRGRGLTPVIATAPVALAFAEAYLWALLTPFIFRLTGRFSIERTSWLSRILLFLGVGAVLAILVEASIGYLRFEVLFTPPRRFGAFDPMFGLTRLFWLDDLIVYIAVVAAGFARDYFLRYRARQEEAVRLQAQTAQLQAQLADAQLSALRAQLNPHFLFNTLHSVSALVERDPRGVRRMIASLSELLRSTLDGEAEQEVQLERELSFIDRYVRIMQIRFQGNLEVELHVDPEVRTALVPTLILQPLVENAMKHGAGKLDGVGRIEIAASRAGDQLVLSVRDNGPGPSPPARSTEGVGLSNTRARLEQLYGDAQSLTLRPADGGGTIAEVKLPFHTRADLRTTGEFARP